MQETTQLCTVTLGDLYLGIEVQHVQEVLKCQQMTRVPLASPAIAGLINLRGQIVIAIDLRRRFGLPARPAGVEPMNVVIRTEEGIASLLVDQIGDVLDLGSDSFEPSPPTLREPTCDLIRGVHKLDGELLLLLDVEQALNFDATCRAGASVPIAAT